MNAPAAFTTIRIEIAQGVATIVLDRPKVKNALNSQMALELWQAVELLRGDDSVGAVILTGGGDDFCAGGDVKEMRRAPERSAEERHAGMARYKRVVASLESLEVPLIAAVDGVAYGAGFSLALLADLVLVTDRVRMSMVFHRIGLVPDLGAYYTLPRVVGLQAAKALIFSAREIGAQEALQFGVAMECVEAHELQPRSTAIARSLAEGSRLANRLSKKALNGSLGSDLATLLEVEATSQALAGGSAYAREAGRRMRDGEPAQFSWPLKA